MRHDRTRPAGLAGGAVAGGGALWFTRFWTAKEAVAKARGTGLRGRPAEYRVVAADENRARVVAGGRLYEVRLEETANPPGLPERHYVVARTTTENDDTNRTGDSS